MTRTYAVAIVAAFAALLGGLWVGTQVGARRAEERVVEARVLEQRIATVLQTLGAVAVERDSLRRVADSAGALRVAKTARAKATFATLGPVPASRPDTCLEWIARAETAEAAVEDAFAALGAAAQEVEALRANLEATDRLNAEMATILGQAESVVAEAGKPAGPSLGQRLLTTLTPKLQVQYGATSYVDPGGILRTHIGPSGFLGWRLQVSLATLF